MPAWVPDPWLPPTVRAVDFSRKKTREYVASIENNLVASALNVLHTFWTQFIPIDGVYELPEGLIEQLPKCLEKFVAFSVIWGCCATSDGASRKNIDAEFRQLLNTTGLAAKVGMPEEGLIFDFTVDVHAAGFEPREGGRRERTYTASETCARGSEEGHPTPLPADASAPLALPNPLNHVRHS